MDNIEDITFEVHDANSATLNIEGDFVLTFKEYLRNEDATGITLLIPQGIAADLYNQLRRYI